jgi:hypothetical protein
MLNISSFLLILLSLYATAKESTALSANPNPKGPPSHSCNLHSIVDIHLSIKVAAKGPQSTSTGHRSKKERCMMRTPFHHPAKNMQDKSIFLMERKGGGKKKTQKAFSILYFQILIRGSNYHLYI